MTSVYMIPSGLKNVNFYESISRCGELNPELEKLPNFRTFRDTENDTYDYVVANAEKFVPKYVKRQSPNPFKNRPTQSEVEQIIQNRLFYEGVLFKRLFNEASKQKAGYILRPDLYEILKYLCPNLQYDQFERILQKTGLDSSTVYFYDTIEEKLKQIYEKPIFRPECRDISENLRIHKASYAFHKLKVFAMEDDFDIHDILPKACFKKNGIVLMPQLRDGLCQLNIKLTDKEFLRLWEKFDKFNVGSTPLTNVYKILNLQDNGRPMCGVRDDVVLKLRSKASKINIRKPECNELKCKVGEIPEIPEIKAGGVSFPITKPHGWVPQGCGGLNEPKLGDGHRYLDGIRTLMCSDHPQYLSVLDNLVYYFETPYRAMLIVFRHYDKNSSGKVKIEEALEIFREYGFDVRMKEFEQFLKESGSIVDHSFINYKHLLLKYQSKSELSLLDRSIKIIIKTQYKDIGIKTLTTLSAKEVKEKLIRMLHGPYMKLMEDLQKEADEKGTVSELFLRQCIDKYVMSTKITDEQWEDFVFNLEFDLDTGRVYYKKFLYLFSQPSAKCRALCSLPADNISTILPYKLRKYEKDPRDLLELCTLIESVLKRRFHFIDKHYKFSTKKTSNILKKELFRELLKNEKIILTNGEMNLVWNLMENNILGSRTYRNIMKFMMTRLKKEAEKIKIHEKYQELKENNTANLEILKSFRIEKKKDKQNEMEKIKNKIAVAMKKDVISITENEAKKILEKIRATVYNNWENIKKRFAMLDIIGATTIESFEMMNFSENYFPNLSKQEVTTVVNYFDKNKNGRFHYMDFLNYFQLISNDTSTLIKYDVYRQKLNDKKNNNEYFLADIKEKLRKSLVSKWQNLLISFRKMDKEKEGLLDIEIINRAFKQIGINLSDDDLYHILTDFDCDMDGKIDYYEFIKQMLDIGIVKIEKPK